MNRIFVDSLNWFEYAKDSEGNLWLLDYPHSEMHGGGAQRQRRLVSDIKILDAFEAFLQILEEHTQELHSDSNTTQPHLAAVGNLAVALASDSHLEKYFLQARRTFGWSFLPEAWGESIEAAWTKFAALAEKTIFTADSAPPGCG